MLIKHHEHGRKVCRKQNSYLKTYTPNHLDDYDWLVDNVKQLEKFMPGYVIDYGIKDNELYLETKIIPGKTAHELWIELDKKQAQTFVHGIIDFCIEQYKATKPYSHGDWELSNIIKNESGYTIIDWDELEMRSDVDVYFILKKKLKRAFEDYFDIAYFNSVYADNG